MPMHESHLNPLRHKGHPSTFPYRGFLYKCIWETTFGYHFKTVNPMMDQKRVLYRQHKSDLN